MAATQNKNGAAFVALMAEAISAKLRECGADATVTINGVFDQGFAFAENMRGSAAHKKMELTVRKAADVIAEYEPFFCAGVVEVLVSDKAREGDPRDILLRKIEGDAPVHEIGIVARWNSDSSKSSRIGADNLGKTLWGHKESPQWKEETGPVWQKMEELSGRPWDEIKDKNNEVYRPITEALMHEFEHAVVRYPDAAFNFAQNSVGRNDYWEVIGHPMKKSVTIRGFSLHGYLSVKEDGSRNVATGKYPSAILSMKRKDATDGTLEIGMDNGWSFTLRIHNGEGIIRPSLKTDVKFTGNPLLIIEKEWNSSFDGKRKTDDNRKPHLI